MRPQYNGPACIGPLSRASPQFLTARGRTFDPTTSITGAGHSEGYDFPMR